MLVFWVFLVADFFGRGGGSYFGRQTNQSFFVLGGRGGSGCPKMMDDHTTDGSFGCALGGVVCVPKSDRWNLSVVLDGMCLVSFKSNPLPCLKAKWKDGVILGFFKRRMESPLDCCSVLKENQKETRSHSLGVSFVWSQRNTKAKPKPFWGVLVPYNMTDGLWVEPTLFGWF